MRPWKQSLPKSKVNCPRQWAYQYSIKKYNGPQSGPCEHKYRIKSVFWPRRLSKIALNNRFRHADFLSGEKVSNQKYRRMIMTSFLNQLAGLIIDGKRNKGEKHYKVLFNCNFSSILNKLSINEKWYSKNPLDIRIRIFESNSKNLHPEIPVMYHGPGQFGKT